MTEIGILFAFFALVMGLMLAAGYALVYRPAWAGQQRAEGSAEGAALQEPVESSWRGSMAHLLRLVGEALPSSRVETALVRKRLLTAGYRWPSAVGTFYGVRWACAGLLGVLMGWAVAQARESVSAAILPALAAVMFGYLLPDRILRMQIQARSDRIRCALPDAVDLMVLSVEAGQSLDQALIDTSLELRAAYPDLAAELGLVHLELRAGRSRPEALHSLADRNNEPELRKLVNLLIQSDRFGTSMGPALRTHARYLRIRRKQRAEEAARKVSVKLIFPIFFLIFPAMLVVTAGPAVLQIFTQLIPLITGE